MTIIKRSNCYSVDLKSRVIILCLNKNKRTTNKQIASMFSISLRTLYIWIRRHKEKKSLIKQKYNKRKIKLKPKIRNYIKRYVNKHNFVTLSDLKNIIKTKFNISLSLSYLSLILKQLKITYKKINPAKIHIDPELHKQKVKVFLKNIKTINKDDILSIDEVHFNNQDGNLYAWSKTGTKVKVVKKVATKHCLSAICVISNKIIIGYKIVEDSVNSQTFVNFLKELIVGKYENKYLLLDNASIHRSKIVKEFMETSTNKLVYNVPYSPESNPIEKVFSKTKKHVRNELTKSNYKKDLLNAIDNGFETLTESDLQNYYNASFSLHKLNKHTKYVKTL
jgi:transposase